MIHTRTTWLLFTAGAVVALAVLVLLLLQSQKPKGTLIPPPGSHKAGDIWVANLAGKTTMEMVWCPPGKFLMGSPATEMGRGSNEFQHEATFTKGFWIGKYEITQRQWLALMGDNPSRSPQKEVVYWKIWKWEVPVWCKDFLVIRCQFPVDYVSWDDGQNFCQKAGDGFHLPTEAQWEYACRAGNTGSFAGTGVWKEMGWFYENSGRKIHPVGRKKPNTWGLYDMQGNVQEWSQDWYGGDYSTDAVVDPKGPSTGEKFVICGGDYRDDAIDGRAASRIMGGIHAKSVDLGFRVVFSAETLGGQPMAISR